MRQAKKAKIDRETDGSRRKKTATEETDSNRWSQSDKDRDRRRQAKKEEEEGKRHTSAEKTRRRQTTTERPVETDGGYRWKQKEPVG